MVKATSCRHKQPRQLLTSLHVDGSLSGKSSSLHSSTSVSVRVLYYFNGPLTGLLAYPFKRPSPLLPTHSSKNANLASHPSTL